MADILQIWWVRHSHVAESGRYIGHTDIPALIPPAPANLAIPLPPVARWVSSPLLRATQTAKWIMESCATGQELEIAPELMEQNFGSWEGKTYDEAWQEMDVENQDWSSPATIKPKGGESFIGVCARVDHWLDRQIKKTDGTPIIAVAHAGVIRAALRHALNLIPETALSFCTDYGSVTHVEYFLDESAARIVYVNR